MGAPAPVPFTGSTILKRWNEQRQLERQLTHRTRRGLREPGFAGASIGRLTASLSQWSGSINADLDRALVVLRARARSLCANSEYGRRFLSLVSANIVGACGPTLQVRARFVGSGDLNKAHNDAIETHFARWAMRADVTGKMSLAQLFRVSAKGTARDGEALLRFVRNRSLPYGLALQALEPDRLAETYNTRLQNGNTVRQGVEIDSMMRPVAYYLYGSHPGENFNMAPGYAPLERVPAEDILHLFVPEREEQFLGYTWMHAVLMRAAMLHGYEEAAVVAARVGASKVGIWQRTQDSASDLAEVADGQDTSNNALLMNAEPGDMIEAPVGYEFTSWNPDYPHQNFESFVKQCLRGYAMGADIATHNLSGDMTGVNYSSARIAELSERDLWTILQEWFISAACMPIFREWLGSALLLNQVTSAAGSPIPADRFSTIVDAARFQGRRWEWTDPLNEANAQEKRIELRIDSRTRIAASQGRDFEDIVTELKQEKEMLDAAGLSPSAPAPKDPAPPAEDTPPSSNSTAKETEP